MRFAFASILFFSLVASSTAQPVFSGWNASRLDVKNAEAGRLINQRADKIVYQSYWMGYPIVKKYVFFKGNLKRSVILFNSRYEQKNKYIEEFEQINRQLEQVYGSSRTTDPLVIINKKLSRQSSLSKGQKLLKGLIAMETEWYTRNTYVRHTIRGNGYEIIHVVVFSSPDHKTLANGF